MCVLHGRRECISLIFFTLFSLEFWEYLLLQFRPPGVCITYITSSLHHNITTSQHHIITASHHHIFTTSHITSYTYITSSHTSHTHTSHHCIIIITSSQHHYHYIHIHHIITSSHQYHVTNATSPMPRHQCHVTQVLYFCLPFRDRILQLAAEYEKQKRTQTQMYHPFSFLSAFTQT